MGRVDVAERRRSGPPRVEVSSLLDAPPGVVWAAASTLRGVNHELGPWIRMTGPQDASFEAAAPGERFARSWLLLLGLVPFDFDDLTFERVGPAGFLERSRTLTASSWEHERTIEQAGGGCRVTDSVRFTPRVRIAAPLQRVLVAAVFRHRHRRLRRRYGSP